MKKLTVIICTYNRSDLLQECLESIVNQSMDDRNFDVVVVDNNSSDRTKEVVDSMAGKYHNVHYLKEENQGLSHARNAGWRLAKTEWVNYLDDDAISHNDYVEKILETIQQYDYPIFGGVYHQWFKFGRPDWFPETEGTNKYLLSKTGVLS
ncbi:MAG: glycosyltransferase family 2 protein [Imperialibacter sp.]